MRPSVTQAVVKGKIYEVVTFPASCSVVAKVKHWLLLKLNGIFFVIFGFC